jgi:hypothetical protein
VTFDLPQRGDTQRFISWLHDNATVETVDHGVDSVQVTAKARSEVAVRARERAPSQ